MKRYIALGILTAGMALQGAAQQLPLYNQYYSVPFLYNPALAGSTEHTNLSLIHKSMWRDIPGAPVTSALAIEGPIQEKNFGLGASLYSDVTDITHRIGFSGVYSYRLKIDDDNEVLFGLSFGVLDNKIDFSRAVVQDQNDPYLLNNTQHKMALDANFGIVYNWTRLEVGVAFPQFAGNSLKYVNENSSAYYNLRRHIIGTAKYTFYISEAKLISVYPLVAVRYANAAPLQYDVNAVLDWASKGWFGVTYRSNYAVGLNLGVRLNNTLRAGYAYDLAIGSIKNYSGGSHEIFLGYTFGKKEEEKKDESADRLKQDLLVDSMIAVLKKQNDDDKKKMENMQQQIDSLKKNQGQGGANSPGGNNPGGNTPGNSPTPSAMNDSTGTMRMSNASDFKDEEGKMVMPNYYVIVGAFKNKEGAEEQKKKYIMRGFPLTTIFFNDKKNLYYVCVVGTTNEEAANKELADAKFGTPDAWIFVLK
ncbi:MAG: PorP/SprF family type IX secretion system membrane protein [Bacteroidota bacterium]